MIYLDNNATTRVREEVIEAMLPFLRDSYGNPSAGYNFGKRAREAVETARARVAALIEARPEEIVFTSGGTEADNTAIASCLAAQPDCNHLVTTAAEHSAVEKHCAALENKGIEVTRLPLDREGFFDLEDLRKAIRPGETALVSIIWANNETGVLSPIREAAQIARESGVVFHSDAVQAAGKVPVSVEESGVHLLSLSGHKLHAPKGVGALYVNRLIRFQPLIIGGGQEGEKRSGTENVAGIVGFGAAAELAREELGRGREQELRGLRDRFEHAVLKEIEGTEINGDRERRLPNTSNIYFEGVDAEGLLILLDEEGVCCSPGSACSTGVFEPSRVIMAMGFTKERAKSSVRFSFSLENTEDEADRAVEILGRAVSRIRSVRPARKGRVIVRES